MDNSMRSFIWTQKNNIWEHFENFIWLCLWTQPLGLQITLAVGLGDFFASFFEVYVAFGILIF